MFKTCVHLFILSYWRNQGVPRDDPPCALYKQANKVEVTNNFKQILPWFFIGLLCQHRVIMMVEKLVEWLAGETEVLGENLLQSRFVHHKPHMLLGSEPGAAAVGSQRLTAWTTARP
jgi:hypothetical protein